MIKTGIVTPDNFSRLDFRFAENGVDISGESWDREDALYRFTAPDGCEHHLRMVKWIHHNDNSKNWIVTVLADRNGSVDTINWLSPIDLIAQANVVYEDMIAKLIMNSVIQALDSEFDL